MSTDFDFSRCYTLNPELVEEEVDGDRVVLNPDAGKIITFEQLTAVIWEIMQSQDSFAVILELMHESFSVDDNRLKQDLADFWVGLIEDNIIFIKD